MVLIEAYNVVLEEKVIIKITNLIKDYHMVLLILLK